MATEPDIIFPETRTVELTSPLQHEILLGALTQTARDRGFSPKRSLFGGSTKYVPNEDELGIEEKVEDPTYCGLNLSSGDDELADISVKITGPYVSSYEVRAKHFNGILTDYLSEVQRRIKVNFHVLETDNRMQA